MAGTCTGTVTVTVPCVPNWTGGAWGQCGRAGTQTRQETDGCGNTRTASQACTYREASLVSCATQAGTQGPGEFFTVNAQIASGTLTESYTAALTGSGLDFTTTPFTVAGTVSATTTQYNLWFPIPTSETAGTKSYSISLNRVP